MNVISILTCGEVFEVENQKTALPVGESNTNQSFLLLLGREYLLKNQI